MIQPSSLRPQWRVALWGAFFLSGAAGLVYEVIWTRMFGMVFGNTNFAVATVLATFMGGMALGAWLFGRLADRSKKPVFLYGLLELGVGAYAFLLPVLLRAAEGIYRFAFATWGYDFTGFSILRLLVGSSDKYVLGFVDEKDP
ncbi:MAG TPA: hypothetical protein ENJ12_02470 [Thiolapillus brandeum]|uniref:Spermidine synthase n=1 Tax=Thiolapillus brandeum TaxID=1076588 RepID=A0A831W7F9_9GAMM|nr:hypothetical protein [Thiolapillus brandeum]